MTSPAANFSLFGLGASLTVSHLPSTIKHALSVSDIEIKPDIDPLILGNRRCGFHLRGRVQAAAEKKIRNSVCTAGHSQRQIAVWKT
jgi:hypothetical protein